MFSRILVPLDGSERAERAIPIAVRLVRASGGSIILLRVVASPIEPAWQASESPSLMQGSLDADIAQVERPLFQQVHAGGIMPRSEPIKVRANGIRGIGSAGPAVVAADALILLIVRPPDIMEKSNLTWDDATLLPM